MKLGGTTFLPARKALEISGQVSWQTSEQISETISETWAAAEGGGKTYRVNLGGGDVLQSVLSKTTFGGLRNWGLVWSLPLSFKGSDRESPNTGGAKRIVGGGSKNVFGEGFFAEFTVCFLPP